jgi:sugar lactone lactonase YvrE
MTLRAWTAAVAAALVAGAALAQSAPTEGDVAAFFRLRREGVAAVNAGDLATAEAKLAEADRRIPNHPGLTILRAKVEAAQEDFPAAIALLDRYAAFGLTTDLADPVLERVSVESEFAPVRRRLSANAAPVGKLELLGSIEGPYLAEAVVWDAAGKRWLISGVHGRTIVEVKGKKLGRFLEPHAEVDAVMGLALDAPRRVLWAASSGMPQAKDLPADRKGRAALLKIDLRSGRVLQRYAAPAGRERTFGDVALAPDGTVYVSDASAGEIWRLPAGGSSLELLVPAGVLGSPQGLALSPDGRRLVVADYSSGLHTVHLASGAVARLPVPANASLVGTDGLLRHGGDLIAIQNGVTPQRVVRLTLDAGFSRVERWAPIAANLPQLSEPTTGVIQDGALVFIARSQWTDFKDDGTLRSTSPGPAILARLPLN